MSHISSSSEEADAAELVLPLSDRAHLFNAPPADPLSRSPAEVLSISGVEHLLNLLHMDKQRQKARQLVLLLSPEKASSASAEQITRALHRLAELRIECEHRELRGTYRSGWRMLGVAVILLAVCLALASIFTSHLTEGMRPLTRQTFEYGFEIIGWVLLWHPIDVLAFAPLAIRARIAALQSLVGMEVVIRADKV
ncbi:hypothetical protein CfE428DRAFT_6089 [Chthoniobacter flavus Ellin428]|uniref:Uncharacterized protein n=1 Tax=Chthoniobacter flavus Ellin428 TaxID=497964 RepID=B4DAZ8_9BACT|nr:hypothetical protein [Chthoniobacter flavus]EDY16372.1 hypothetical protein CfE428DRAFT_6089 [Chthoniobacter flavus Ellin428]TCO92461.1 hypothetical protein EV701_106230 [Chthoniobacter flavus]